MTREGTIRKAIIIRDRIIKVRYLSWSLFLALLFISVFTLYAISNKEASNQTYKVSSIASQFDEVPKLMLPVLVESLGRDQSSYHIIEEEGYFKAQTDSQGIKTEFREDGITFSRQNQSVTMSLIGEGELELANFSNNKIEYKRGDIVEWYINSPLGIEQGFTINTAPEGKEYGEKIVLHIALEMNDNIKPQQSKDGSSINFIASNQEAELFSYSGLYAYDSHGKELPSKMRLLDSLIEIEVDDRDAKYPIVIDPFIEAQKITPSDFTNAPWLFGGSVSISGNTAIVGALAANGFEGRAYIFNRSNRGLWSETQILRGSDVVAGDFFGNSVHISGDLAIVGATHVGNGGQGNAYIFERDPFTNMWNEVAIITGSTGAPGDFYGIGSSIDESTGRALVGANRAFTVEGRAYMYERDAMGVWNEVQVLAPSGGMPGFQYGFRVSLKGDISAVGAFGGDRVYVYEKDGAGVWNEYQILTASDTMVGGESFGVDVDFDDRNMIIGASQFNTNQGKIYFFEKDIMTDMWSETQIERSPSPLPGEFFGSAVSISGNLVVASASLLLTGPGRVFLYERDAMGMWTEIQEMKPSDGTPGDTFGVEISLDGNQLIIGAAGENTLAGAAYLYDGPPPPPTTAVIPTLNGWAMIVMILFLGLLGAYVIRKRHYNDQLKITKF